MDKKTIVIINMNTPHLTEACIQSIRKQGCNWPIVVFDNSRDVHWPAGEGLPARTIEAKPLIKRIKGVKVIYNTIGQVIDFDAELAKFPQRVHAHGAINGWGSDVHMWTVDKLFDLLPDGFILVESDVLVKGDITQLWREEYSFCGYVQKHQRGNKYGIGRILPMLCYFNVPKFKAEGVRYFDPKRSWMLHPNENSRSNWYDTAASLLEDVLTHRPRLKGLHIDIRPLVEHFGGGSYRATESMQREWLNRHAALWQPEKTESKPKTVKRGKGKKK